MIAFILRTIHAPAWIVFPLIFGLYILTAGWWLINGYTRELFGSPLPNMGRIHKVVLNWHTGLPVRNMKSHGDQRHFRKVAAAVNRATPEGATVYFTRWKRWQRALRNNIITIDCLLVSCGMALDPKTTVICVTLSLFFGAVAFVILFAYLKREHYRNSHPRSPKPYALTDKAKAIFRADGQTEGARPVLAEESKPQLTGVPLTVLASLLAAKMGSSAAEITTRLKMNPDKGELVLPDTFGALIREREPVEEIIDAHTDGKVRFEWKTTVTPRTISWVPVIEHRLPTSVRFRDFLNQIEQTGPREFAVGQTADRSIYVASHRGDKPWHCRFAGSGTGKSMGFLVKAAQVCHKDPEAEVYCVDTKQVSFEYLHDIPRVYIYDNPVSEMDKIWEVFYTLKGIMIDRYTAVREGRARFSDFHDIWLFVDEGNDLGGCLKSYNTRVLEGKTASPSIWGECVGPLLRQGRQVNIFGEWMFQDLTDKAMGGESLKMAFSTFGAAGFLPGQFTRTIGPPAPDLIEGPGKILMCNGIRRDWVQGFYDDEGFLHEYALENRKRMAA